LKITVLIPTFNCQSTIQRTLNSVKWADQILIIDSYSTDDTLELLKSFDVTLYQNHYINSAKQKNWALKFCKNEWILQIDSDEVLEENAREIIFRTIKRANENIHCFKMARKNHVLGKWIKNGGLYPDWQNRLFKKEFGKWEDKDVHSKIKVKGEIKDIDLHIIHHGMPNISKQLANLNRYTRYEANYLIKRGKKFSYFRMLFGPFLVFLYRYIFLRGFIDGWRGFFLATYIAIYYFITQSKLHEIEILDLDKSPK
tara:strand:- start:65 stop:832 length:768 start_codon:yes stop_codon:yes gene_type:complete